jgi:hypothetical protein
MLLTSVISSVAFSNLLAVQPQFDYPVLKSTYVQVYAFGLYKYQCCCTPYRVVTDGACMLCRRLENAASVYCTPPTLTRAQEST